MPTVSAQRLATIFVEVADTLVDELDLIDFLHMLTDRAASLVDAAEVGIVLAEPGRHRTSQGRGRPGPGDQC